MKGKVYTVREFRTHLKEALDYATALYVAGEEDEMVEIMRDGRRYCLFDGSPEDLEVKPNPPKPKKPKEEVPEGMVEVNLKEEFEKLPIKSKLPKCGHPELRDGMCGQPKCPNSVYAK